MPLDFSSPSGKNARHSTFSTVVIYIKRLSGTAFHTKRATHMVQLSTQNEKSCMNTAHQLCYHHYHHHHVHEEREKLIREVSKQDNWPVEKSDLVNKHIKHFIQFANAIDFEKL